MSFPIDLHSFTPYQETSFRKGKPVTPQSQAPFQHLPFNDANPNLDQNGTIQAVQTILDEIPISVLGYIINRSADWTKALISLLEQLQNGVDRGWLTDVIHSERSPWTEQTFDDISVLDPVHRNVSMRSRISNSSDLTGTTYNNSLSIPGELWPPNLAYSIPEEGAGSIAPEDNMDYTQQGFGSSRVPQSYTPFPLGDLHDANDMQPALQQEYSNDPSRSNDPGQVVDGQSYCFPEDASMLGLEEPLGCATPLAVATPRPQADYTLEAPKLSLNLTPVNTSPSSGHTSTRSYKKARPKSHHFMKSQSADKKGIKGFVQHQFPPPSRNASSQVPCPQCKDYFVSRNEFAKHIEAQHDQSIQYSCSHHCSFPGNRTWRPSILKRHHTVYHPDCPQPQLGPSVPTPCCVLAMVGQQRRVRGCSLCVWVTESIEMWAKHQINSHKGNRHEDLNRTWLIKSLLSQERLQPLWNLEIERLAKSTGYNWDISWSDEEDAALDELVDGLETGYWNGKDYFIDEISRQSIVKDAIAKSRRTPQPILDKKDPMSTQPSSSSPTGVRSQKSFRDHFHIRCQRSKPNLNQSTTESSSGNKSISSSGASSVDFSKTQIIPVRSAKTRRNPDHDTKSPSSYGVVHDGHNFFPPC